MVSAKGSIASFTDLECWHWHAYDYAFRRVFLGVRDAHSTVDPEGDWFDSRIVSEAEIWLREKHGMAAAKPWPAPARHDQIRDNCRKIPRAQLTDLEMQFLESDFIAMMRRAKANIEAAGMKWRSAFRGPRSTRHEVEAPTVELRDVTLKDPALIAQAKARVGL